MWKWWQKILRPYKYARYLQEELWVLEEEYSQLEFAFNDLKRQLSKVKKDICSITPKESCLSEKELDGFRKFCKYLH